MTSIRLSEIRHLVEETLAAGTLLPPPRRFAKPGPARAPRPPDSHTRNPPLISWEDRWRAAPYDKLLEYRSLRVQLVRSAASAGYGSCYPEGFADRLRLEETRNKMYDLAFFPQSMPSFTSQGRQLVSSATASKSTRDGRVVKILVYFTAELLVLISLWLLEVEDLIPNIKQSSSQGERSFCSLPLEGNSGNKSLNMSILRVYIALSKTIVLNMLNVLSLRLFGPPKCVPASRRRVFWSPL